MTSTAIDSFDDDGEPVVRDAKAMSRQRNRAIRKAYREGGLDVLEEFVPGILVAMQRTQELLPKVYDLVEQCIEEKDTSSLKDIAPLVKMLLDENKRLLDRRFGTSVQRTQNDTTVKVQHVSLRGLIEQRRLAEDEAAGSAAIPPIPSDEYIVDAEVIPE